MGTSTFTFLQSGLNLSFMVIFACLVAACSSSGSGQGSDSDNNSIDSSSDGDSDDPSQSWDSDSDSSSDSMVDPLAYPRLCPDIYDENLLPTFEVEIDNSEWQAMRQDCQDGMQQYRSIVLQYGDETYDAMMRLKGNWSWNCDKMQFVISFNEVNSGGRFHGVRKLVMDAPWYDPTFLHERVAFYYMHQYGVPYSCVNNARLNINGEFYGLYANVERLDKEYLERHFENSDGNLFAGGVELKTNEDVGDTDIVEQFWNADTLSAVEQVVNVEQAISIWAGLAMVPDPDSYWAGVEINFYLYEHPEEGLLFLPYDMDISFAEELWPELAEADPITYEHEEWLREVVYETVLSDPVWCERFVEKVQEAYDAYDVTALEEKIVQWSEQIAAAAETDPHKTFDLQEHLDAVSTMLTFPARRKAFVADWLAEGDHCPPNWLNTPNW